MAKARKRPKRKAPRKAPAKKKSQPKRLPRIAWQRLTLREAASVISQHIAPETGKAILIGASCAALYAPSLQSSIIELVVDVYHVNKMRALMRQLGFRPIELRSFKHADAPFEIVFPPPPVVVGDEPVDVYTTVKTDRGPLAVLSPTDCVRHRLAAWYRWGDEEALHQAVAVAKRRKIDFQAVKEWSSWEWENEKFEEFVKLCDTN